MTVEEKLWKLVQRLLIKTEQGEVPWEETASKSVFQAAFPNYVVRIMEVDNNTEPDYILMIMDENGKVLERASDPRLREAVAEAKMTAFKDMQRLFALARSTALGVDYALDNLLGLLD